MIGWLKNLYNNLSKSLGIENHMKTKLIDYMNILKVYMVTKYNYLEKALHIKLWITYMKKKLSHLVIGKMGRKKWIISGFI